MSAFILPLTGQSFRGAFAVANSSSSQSFSQSDILRAALLVGRTRRDAGRFGAQSWLEALWRISTIRLGLDLQQPPPGVDFSLRRHSNWGRLDGSERGVLNYNCGNVVAKLVAERVLRAPLLLHQDVYRNFLGSPLGKKDPRPDFVGWSPWVATLPPHHSPWIAMEAKGRTRFPRKATSKARRNAKTQAKSLKRVRGMNVAVHVACWSYENGGSLRAFYEDPEPDEIGLQLDISDGDFAGNYYAPVAEVLRVSQLDSRNENTVIYTMPGLDLRLAVHRKLDGLIREPEHMADWLGVLPRINEEQAVVGDTQLGPDGIAVLPGDSWLRRAQLTGRPDAGKGGP